MMGYNLTEITNANGLGGLYVGVNNLADGLLFGGLIFALYIMISITLIARGTEFEKAFLVSGFIMIIPTLIMAGAGWINMKITLWILFLLAFAGLGSYLVKRFSN